MKRKLFFLAALTLVGLVAGTIFKRAIGQSPSPSTEEFVSSLQAGVTSQAPPPSSIGTITPADGRNG
jgi:hypothetical protein